MTKPQKKGTGALRRAQQREEKNPVLKAATTARIIHWRETVEWSSLAPAQRSHADGLAQAMSFLPLNELVIAAQACRQWRTAALQAPPLDVSIRNANGTEGSRSGEEVSPRLQSIAASPFRKHIRVLRGGDVWSVAELRLLTHLHHLKILNLILGDLPRSESVPSDIAFPPSLHFVSAVPSRGARGAAMWRGVLESLAGEPVASMRCVLEPKIDFSAVESLQQIHEVVLDGILGIHWDLKTFRHIKQLQNLETLRIFWPQWARGGSWRPQPGQSLEPFLSELFKKPNRMQLTAVSLDDTMNVTSGLTKLLAIAPSLTTFGPYNLDVDAIPEFHRFSSLQQVIVRDFDMEAGRPIPEPLFMRMFRATEESKGLSGDYLVEMLRPCARSLTVLNFPFVSFGEQEAEELCSTFTKLHDLRLNHAQWPSLKSLRHLTSLSVFKLELMPKSAFSLSVDDARALFDVNPSAGICVCGIPDQTDPAIIAMLADPAKYFNIPALKMCVHKHVEKTT